MASQVMTISRICVLLWLIIFFEAVRTTPPSTITDADTSPYATEAVRTTPPSTITDADTSPYATESVTTASTFTDADTSPYASDNRTENVTMATDLPATTISNNRTENVTMATDLPATTISNNRTENVTMATDLPATTISNNATENMTMATDLPATTIPNNTTENVTMVTDLPATTIPNNTTENMTMATDLSATTISNNTTENVTMVTDLPATTVANNTTENVTMVTDLPATTVATNTTELVTTGTPVHTSTPSYDTPRDIIFYIIVGFFPGFFVGVIFSYFTCSKRRISDEKTSSPLVTVPSAKIPTTGSMSRVELWKMVEYAKKCHEMEKLSKVINNLTKGLSDDTYGSTGNTLRGAKSKEESYYQKLVFWKGKYKGATQMEIYRIGFEARMRETMKKLQDFRGTVSNMVPSTDLEHILWQIGGKSSENISQLLEALGVNPQMQPNASLKEMVNEAYNRLQTWQEGYVPISPVVMLSLALEAFEISPLEEFFQVPENQKKPLEEAEKKKYASDATIRHCKRILEVIRSEGGDDVVIFSSTVEENDKGLFNTYRMVEDWLEQQETSNYKKRRDLEDATERVKISEPDTGQDLFSAKAIREAVSTYGEVEAAVKLLMTDIRPFSEALGVDSKLADYKVKDSHFERGTVGLVSQLVDLNGKGRKS